MRDPEMPPSFAYLGSYRRRPFNIPQHLFPWARDWLEPVHEVSVADWLVKKCLRWPRTSVGLNQFPVGYEACVRVLHPASIFTEGKEHIPVRWSEVASWEGHTVRELTEFHEITDIYKWNGMEIGSRPDEGKLPSKECEILAGIVRGFTETPELCFFSSWDGHCQVEMDPSFALRPKFKIFDREYYLFRGDLNPAFAGKAFEFESPAHWWPADRAWCIYTDIDGMYTLIGGSAACIEAVLNHPELEALPITLDARVDCGGDTLNPPVDGQ